MEHGIEHHKAGRGEEAEKVYRAVLAKVPNQPDALNLLGVLAMEAGNHEAAFDLLGRAGGRAPERSRGPEQLRLTRSLSCAGSRTRSNTSNARYAIKPDMPDAWLNLGRTYNMAGQGDRALKCFERLLKLKPDSQSARSGISRAMMSLGRTQEAEATARELIAASPTASIGYVNLSNARKFKPDDPEIARVEELIASKDTGAKELRGLYFAAAKMCDDIGRYDDAFRYYDTANKAAAGKYDPKLLEQSYADLKKTYTRKFFAERETFGVDSERPVFIVGMPRSGTTLTETIIGAHPKVFAAGELETIKRCEREMADLVFRDEGVQKNARELSWVGVEILAQRYLDAIDAKARNASAVRVTDKMPHNFQAVGFIALLFPKARIIHTRRNPFDTCLSIWQQNFNDAHTYARNLADLGHHYATYLNLMEHWREVLPGRMLEIDYEDLVENQEQVSRKLIDFIGLDWDDACLRPQDVKRTVLTASVWQVRQPVYKRSAGRWKITKRTSGRFATRWRRLALRSSLSPKTAISPRGCNARPGFTPVTQTQRVLRHRRETAQGLVLQPEKFPIFAAG
ncbi:MAG: tetratricopeptide repeat protein [Candidatus Competibacteraceae bacterium]|nr:tetratricopeptide repeat protein [Candidatus Competibacteraceae bacterium]